VSADLATAPIKYLLGWLRGKFRTKGFPSDGCLGVSPRFKKIPQDWGIWGLIVTISAFSHCFPGHSLTSNLISTDYCTINRPKSLRKGGLLYRYISWSVSGKYPICLCEPMARQSHHSATTPGIASSAGHRFFRGLNKGVLFWPNAYFNVLHN
jgi:hypothetical protein